MSIEVVTAILATVTTLGLAWIAAWQQRAAKEVRKLNGTVAQAVQHVAAEVVDLHPKLDKVAELQGQLHAANSRRI